jgi:hypothetical protein
MKVGDPRTTLIGEIIPDYGVYANLDIRPDKYPPSAGAAGK